MNDKRIKVYLVLLEESVQNQLRRVLMDMPEVTIIGVQADGEKAYQDIWQLKPEIVICELLMTGMDGFTMLQMLEEMLGDNCPKFILCYGFLPEALQILKEEAPVLQCITFPVKDFVLVKQLRTAFSYYSKQRTEELKMQESGPPLLKEEPEVFHVRASENRRRDIIAYELYLLGMPAEYKGYQYIICALDHLLEQPQELVMMMIYKQVAEEFQTAPSSVERSIRTVIRKMWTVGNRAQIYKVFATKRINDDTRPDAFHFLSRLLLWLRREYIL